MLAIAGLMLASTCTVYGSTLPGSKIAEAAGTTPAEVSCSKQCPVQLLRTCLRGAAHQTLNAS